MRNLLVALAAVLLFTGQLLAQKVITGKVTDDKGISLANVSILVKGTNTGTVTQPDGSFSINVPANAKTLVISSVGLETQEISIGSQSTVAVSLKTANTSLQEVVVTALGVRKEKKSLGYSVSEVKGQDIANTPNQNLINSLSGKVAGLQVISSGGSPGMASRIVIRGGNKSLLGDNQPLFVIDGMPISNANDGNNNTVTGAASPNRAADINPDDIETVSVLKGSAASVLYGNRGANGVILITTKSGKSRIGRPVVTLSQTTGFTDALKLPDFQNSYAQGQLSGGVPTYAEGTSTSFGPKIEGQQVTSTGAGGTINLKAHNPREEFLKKGTVSNTNLSIAQSSERGSYYLSLGYSGETSIVPNQEYKKASVRYNASHYLTSKITAGVNVNYIRTWGDVPFAGQDGNNPIFALFNMPVSWDINGYGYQFADGKQKNFRGGSFDNPMWSVNKTFFNTLADRVIGSVNFGYKVLPWMDISYRLGSDFLGDNRKSFRDIYTGGSPNGFLANDYINRFELASTFLLNINRKLTDDLGLAFVAGQDFNQRKMKNTTQTATALTLPGIAHMNNGKSFNPDYEFESKRRLVGVFGDLKLDYRNFLFLGLTARNEWSSTLPADNRSYFYPGVNASLIFTELLKIPSNIFNYGKIRAGYAQTARDANPYSLINVYAPATVGDGFTPGITFPFGSIPGFTVSNTIRNPALKPEMTKEFEIGTELRFLKNRVELDVTYFRNNNTDGIISVDITPTTGATNATVNSGAVKANGIEVGLNVTPVKTNSFKWDLSLNFSRIRSKVIETYPGVEKISLGGFSGNPAIFAVKGERYGSLIGQKLVRDAQGNVIVNASTGRPTFQDGGILGYVEPDWTGGLRNTLAYQNFTFTFLIDTRQGGYMLNLTEDLIDGYGVSKKTASREEDYIYPGVKNTDGKPNDVVVKRNQSWWSAAKVNEEYLYENNWVKLREVNLNYTWTPKNTKLLKSVDVGLYGHNLALWTKIPHVDPESSSFGTGNAQGVTRMAFPTLRSLGVNLKLVF